MDIGNQLVLIASQSSQLLQIFSRLYAKRGIKKHLFQFDYLAS